MPLGTTVTLNDQNYILLHCDEYEQLLHRADSATPATAFSLGAFVASHGDSWMIDSGATTHLTGNRSHFSSLSISHNSLSVRLADGSYSPISGYGTVQPTDHITLTNVLFAPKFPVNLLSVSQLTKKHNCSVTFFPSYCVFQDLQTRRTIGGGHEHGGLYFLDKSTPADARALFASVSPLQWHCRLGHPSLPSLNKILPIESARLECESCELENPTRPLQVYSHRTRSTTTTPPDPPSLPPAAAPRTPNTSANDLPIALRKVMLLELKRLRHTYRSTLSLKIWGGQGISWELKSLIASNGVSLSQRKYACDLLQEAGLLGTKSVDTPMDSNPDFWNDDGKYLKDKTKYRRLVDKLIYLTVTRPDISFAIGLVSQFMDKPRSVHWEAALRILKYIKASPDKGLLFKRHRHVKIEAYSDADYAWSKDDRKSTFGYCTYAGGNLVTWHSKKQTTVARSSAEAEYRAMAYTTSEVLWLKNLLIELGFMYDDPIPMHCDNQTAIHIASNPIFHERTKHIEVDCHFVREVIMSWKICTPFTPSSKQRADIFTKALGAKQFHILCNKLGMIDIFAPACRESVRIFRILNFG
ncbi:UNVERIFIED_CONTAM: Retrovirus-related Pol polyprotein from transposon RE2 [Sesamum latifolium]|uniref:Retrovirus-related Pol polyprotein from transposon RE2 n=1 Tax=Sesamum latifolium TaxID=2727402 RepID=A0AAW2TQS2_9LAMI